DGGPVGEPQHVAGVVGFGPVERDRLARPQRFHMDPAWHGRRLWAIAGGGQRAGGKGGRRFVATAPVDVMMAPDPSDKGEGTPNRRTKGVSMGQAAVDLPDPLESPPPAANTSTDDLLAQLAGDEIDRLLAEAELSASGRSPT